MLGLVLVQTRFRILRIFEISAKLEFLEHNSSIERVTRWEVWQSRQIPCSLSSEAEPQGNSVPRLRPAQARAELPRVEEEGTLQA